MSPCSPAGLGPGKSKEEKLLESSTFFPSPFPLAQLSKCFSSPCLRNLSTLILVWFWVFFWGRPHSIYFLLKPQLYPEVTASPTTPTKQKPPDHVQLHNFPPPVVRRGYVYFLQILRYSKYRRCMLIC